MAAHFISHDPAEEEVAWMTNSLVGVINEGVNYQDIRKGSHSNEVQLTGFCSMGASQALISFNTYDSTMEAFELDIPPWHGYFDELRPCIDTYGPIDRFAWIEATDLPITGRNVTSINKIISAYGRAIGFDKINLGYSNLGHINLLIGKRLHRFIKENTTLWLNGKDYKIKLQELDPLHYLVSEAIEYSMAAFDLMKQEDECETETSTVDTLMLKMLTRLQL